MIATKSIVGGGVVFNEKPLLVTANIFLGPSDTNGKDSSSSSFSCVWCSSCLKIVSDNKDQLNNNKTKSAIQHCTKCEVPLCQECFQQGPIGADNVSNFVKRFFGGQGHTTEECALISDLRQKIPELQNVHQFVKSKDGSGNEKFWGEFLKDITILRILMFRTQCPWRWESFIALRNNPRYLACVKHNFGNLEELMGSSGTGFPVSNHYLKNICKDKSFQVQDIVRIVALFCEVSTQNSNLSVLYENRSWLAHACTPNTEQFYRQSPPTTQGEDCWGQNLEIIVKAVDGIEQGSKITMNFLTNFEGGRSALAMRLFQSKGHYCCDTNCKCYLSTFDKSLGIRCDLVLTSVGSTGSGGIECHACSGIMAPRVEAPNPDKGNLGYGMFMKSKKWECDKCKKTEKYENLHKRISEIALELTRACDRCCSCNSAGGFGKGQSFLQLQNKLLSNLSDQHWMVWKAKMRVLKSWSESFGYASEMLRSAVSLDSNCAERTSLISVVKQKVDMYGGGIYQMTSEKGPLNKAGKMGGGVLDLFARRHGPLSPKRGHLLFDAFYANLIMFLEDYKKELPIPSSRSSSLKRNQIAKENCKKLVVLKKILEETVESLKIAEGTTVAFHPKGGNNRNSKGRCLEMAKDGLELFSKVCTRVEQCPNLIIGYLNDLLELYACQDPHFIHNCVRKSRLKSDPFRRNLDELDFEVNCVNLGEVAFVFGSTVETGQGMGKSSSTTDSTYLPFGGIGGMGGTRRAGNRYTGSFFSSPAAGLFGFGSSGSDPNFGASTDKDSSSEMDDESHANPFVYSRNSRRSKSKNKFSSKRSKSKGAKKGSKAKGQGKKPGGGKEDWKNNLWFSSDDDDTFLMDDDEFDIGFTYSPRSSTFGADLFNDDELEDLAEWAALQFMSGKMKL